MRFWCQFVSSIGRWVVYEDGIPLSEHTSEAEARQIAEGYERYRRQRGLA